MGSPEGGRKAAKILLARDPDYFKKLSAKGGRSGSRENRPFFKDRKLASRAGKIGGTISRKK